MLSVFPNYKNAGSNNLRLIESCLSRCNCGNHRLANSLTIVGSTKPLTQGHKVEIQILKQKDKKNIGLSVRIEKLRGGLKWVISAYYIVGYYFRRIFREI